MNILHVGIFKDHCLGGDIVLKTGFLKNGLIHQEFDYRSIARSEGIEAMNRKMVEAAKGFDLVFIAIGGKIIPSTLASIKKTGSCVVIWYGDMRPKLEPWLINNIKECDVLFMTSAGDILKSYFREGRPGRAAFFFNPSNPDLVNNYEKIPRSIKPPIFTGRAYDFAGEERRVVYKYLCRQKNIQIIGSPHIYFDNAFLRRIYRMFKSTPAIRGSEYIEQIIQARFGIGVNAFQNIKYYTSDRLTHYLTFGKLYLAYHFPGCEDLFQDKIHIAYYKGIEDLDNKMEFYFQNQELAEEIGKRGQQKMLTEYNAEKMVKMMLDIIDKGKSTLYPWVEVYS